MGEPIEELRVTRGGAESTEVVRRLDEPLPEVMLPETVRHHPRGARMGGVGEPPREGEATTGGMLGRHDGRRAAAKESGETRFDRLAQRIRVAALAHEARCNLTARLHCAEDRDHLPFGAGERRETDDRLTVPRRLRLAESLSDRFGPPRVRGAAEGEIYDLGVVEGALPDLHFVEVAAERVVARLHPTDAKDLRRVERLGAADRGSDLRSVEPEGELAARAGARQRDVVPFTVDHSRR